MPKNDQLLKRGIAFIKTGREADARTILQAILHEEPANRSAWGWYVQSFQDSGQRAHALEAYLEVFPHDSKAQAMLAALFKTQRDQWLQEAGRQHQDKLRIQQESQEFAQVTYKTRRSGRLLVALISLFLVIAICYINGQVTQKIESLHRQIGDLTNNYNLLSQRYQELESDYSALQAANTALRTNYDDLQGRYTNLQNEYQNLSYEYKSLESSYEWLETISVQPPYILTSGRQIHLAFNKINGDLLSWDISSEWLEYHLLLGDAQRKNQQYSLKLYNSNTDETYHVVDDREFVDPTPFTYLMSDLYNQSAGEADFIEEVWHIVAQLTAYTSEIQETPRFPMETLLSGGGDCEDHAILFASMILASQPDWNVEFVYMDGENPTQPQTINHVIVRVTTSNRSYLVEATSKDKMNPYSQGVNGWFFTIDI